MMIQINLCTVSMGARTLLTLTVLLLVFIRVVDVSINEMFFCFKVLSLKRVRILYSLLATVIWEKFTVRYFRMKFVHGEIFSSLGVSNE